MHLVMAAALAALCSHAAYADPEADFWKPPVASSTSRSTAPTASSSGHRTVDLGEVVPAGFPDQKVRTDVIPDELHRGAGR